MLLLKKVKEIYFKRLNKKHILKSEMVLFECSHTIFNGKQEKRKYIEWPDAPGVSTKRRHYMFYYCGTMFRYLTSPSTDTRKRFLKSLRPIKEWNAHTFYLIYTNLEESCYESFMWVYPYFLHDKDNDKRWGFTVSDPEKDKDSDLPDRYEH